MYAGAPHGYSMADTSMYDEGAAERHFTELEALLARTIADAAPTTGLLDLLSRLGESRRGAGPEMVRGQKVPFTRVRCYACHRLQFISSHVEDGSASADLFL